MPLGSVPWSARLRYFWNLSRGFPDLTGSFSSRLGLSSVSSFLKIMFALTLLLGAPVAAARSVNPPLARLIQKTLRGSIVENPSDRTPAPDSQRIRTGTWGGQHVRLEVTEDGARLEFDCAHGTIEQRIELDSNGRFEVQGTHTRERGGPARSGETPDRHPARYTGRVEGKVMTLVVTLTDTKETVGTFSLTFGERPELHRCA